jgi:Uncharacterized protein conserved in bacteria
MQDTVTPGNSASSFDFLYPDLEPEMATTRRVLERYPDHKADWRPHEKSMALGALATHLAQLPRLGAMLIEKDESDVSARPQVKPAVNARELLAIFDESLEMLRSAVRSGNTAALEKSWSLKMGDRTLLSGQRRILMRTLLLNHVIHHRAQLGVYYRLLGIPVPGTYGPSADESV